MTGFGVPCRPLCSLPPCFHTDNGAKWTQSEYIFQCCQFSLVNSQRCCSIALHCIALRKSSPYKINCSYPLHNSKCTKCDKLQLIEHSQRKFHFYILSNSTPYTTYLQSLDLIHIFQWRPFHTSSMCFIQNCKSGREFQPNTLEEKDWQLKSSVVSFTSLDRYICFLILYRVFFSLVPP